MPKSEKKKKVSPLVENMIKNTNLRLYQQQNVTAKADTLIGYSIKK